MIYSGGCHCGAVRFEAEAPEDFEIVDCNCSICSMSGFLHLIVPKSAFTLLTDESALSLYTFNTGVAKHYFCKTCGIKPFYIPRSNPDGVDVNVRCFDAPPLHMRIVPFDGKNWEANAHTLVHKSQT
jgi:hypothetical protein